MRVILALQRWIIREVSQPRGWRDERGINERLRAIARINARLG